MTFPLFSKKDTVLDSRWAIVLSCNKPWTVSRCKSEECNAWARHCNFTWSIPYYDRKYVYFIETQKHCTQHIPPTFYCRASSSYMEIPEEASSHAYGRHTGHMITEVLEKQAMYHKTKQRGSFRNGSVLLKVWSNISWEFCTILVSNILKPKSTYSLYGPFQGLAQKVNHVGTHLIFDVLWLTFSFKRIIWWQIFEGALGGIVGKLLGSCMGC